MSTDRESYIANRAIAASVGQTGGEDVSLLLDNDWVRTAFMVSDSELTDAVDRTNRYWSTASGKFTDGRIGGNIGINCPPQYTMYADYPVQGRLQGRSIATPIDTSGNYGWGPYYSEAVDDTRQVVYMRFGVPQFNSLVNYLTRAFDPNQSSLVRTGRTPTILYDAARLLGGFYAVTAFPAIAIPMLAGKVIGAFFFRSTSKFYTLKPTMHLYWSTANMLANTLAVNIGIYPKIMNMNADDTQKVGRPMGIDQEYLTMMSKIMPDIFGGNNYFDLHSMANRAQRLANQIHTQEFDDFNNGTVTDFTGYLKRELSGNGTHSTKIVDKQGKHRLADLIDEALKLSRYYKSDSNSAANMETDPRIDTKKLEGNENTAGLNAFSQYFDAEFRMGSQFATFTVDYTGPQTTSFGSTAVESELANKLNRTSSDARSARFAFAEGNILGDTVTGILGAASDVAMGALDGVTMNMSSFIKGILGDGFVDIPKHWQSSSAQLPRTSYTMTLQATYNTPMSRMLKLYIPLSMILAAALPRSIGKQAYGSPFLVQIFDKGRAQIRLGMIEQLSITAGAGANIGFDNRGNPLAFEVTFTVMDLSSVMHMPVSSGSIGSADMTLDEDNILSDYLAVLASQDIYSQVYPMASARLRAAKMAINAGKWQSPAFWASSTHNAMTSGLLSYVMPIGHVLDAAARGSEGAAGRQ